MEDDLLGQAQAVLGGSTPKGDLLSEAIGVLDKKPDPKFMDQERRMIEARQWAVQSGGGDAPIDRVFRGLGIDSKKQDTRLGTMLRPRDLAMPFQNAITSIGRGITGAENPHVLLKKAQEAYAKGEATDEQLARMAITEYEQNRDKQLGLGASIAKGAAQAAPMLGEALVGGQAVKGAIGAAGYGAKLAPAATATGRAIQSAGLQTAATPLTPSLWLDESQQRAAQNGGNWYDPKNVAAPMLRAAFQNAIMGHLGEATKGMNVAKRIGAGAVLMPAEQAGADALTTLGEKAWKAAGMDEKWTTDTDWGTVKRLANSETRNEGIKELAVQSMMGSMFSAFHGGKSDPVKKMPEALESLKKEGVPQNLAERVVVEAMNRPPETIKNPEVRAYVESIIDLANAPKAAEAPKTPNAEGTPESVRTVPEAQKAPPAKPKTAAEALKKLEDPFGEYTPKGPKVEYRPPAASERMVNEVDAPATPVVTPKKRGLGKKELVTQKQKAAEEAKVKEEAAKVNRQKDQADADAWLNDFFSKPLEETKAAQAEDAKKIEAKQAEQAAGFDDAFADMMGMEKATPLGGGFVPKSGLVVANIGKGGKIYYGRPGDIHASLSERYPHADRGDWEAVGFAGPDGKFLTREQALEFAQKEGKVKTSENMKGQLDAMDYRESVEPAKPVEPIEEVERRIMEGTREPERRRPEGLKLVNPEKLTLDNAKLSEVADLEKFGDNHFRLSIADDAGKVIGEARIGSIGDTIHVPVLFKHGLEFGEGRGKAQPFGAKEMKSIAEQIAMLDPEAKKLVFTRSEGNIRAGVEREIDLTKVRNNLAKKAEAKSQPQEFSLTEPSDAGGGMKRIAVKGPDGREVGAVEYFVDKDGIRVGHVGVESKFQRRGLATKLYDEMRRLNPGLPIRGQLRTSDGDAFRAKYDAKSQPETPVEEPKQETPDRAGKINVERTEQVRMAIADSVRGLEPAFGEANFDAKYEGAKNKFFIEDVYNAIKGRLPDGMTLDQFKEYLVKNRGEFDIARLDLVQAVKDRSKIDRSEIKFGNAAYHVINVPNADVNRTADLTPAAKPAIDPGGKYWGKKQETANAQPEPSPAERPAPAKTKLDHILDRVDKDGEVTLTMQGDPLTREEVKRVIDTAKARGIDAAFDGNNFLFRKLGPEGAKARAKAKAKAKKEKDRLDDISKKMRELAKPRTDAFKKTERREDLTVDEHGLLNDFATRNYVKEGGKYVYKPEPIPAQEGTRSEEVRPDPEGFGQPVEQQAAQMLADVMANRTIDQGPGTAMKANFTPEKAEKAGRTFVEFAKDFYRQLGGATAPQIDRASPESANKVAQFVNARGYTDELAPVMIDKILPSDPTKGWLDLTAGSVLTEMRLRHMRQAYLERSVQEQDPVLKKEYFEAAKKVKSIVGQPIDGDVLANPLMSEADFQRYSQDPEVQDVLAKWKENLVPFMDQQFRDAEGLDPAEDIPTFTQMPGLPMNLMRWKPGSKGEGVIHIGPEPSSAVAGLNRAKLGKLGFAQRATGAAEGYHVRLSDLVHHSILGSYETAAKARMIRTMVDEGMAKFGRPGFSNAPEGFTAEVPNVKPPRGTQKAMPDQTSLWFKTKGEANEFIQALDIGRKYQQLPMAGFFNLMVLRSLGELTAHTSNLLTGMMKPGMSVRDLYRNAKGVITKDKAIQDRIVELARIGAMKAKGLETHMVENPGVFQKYDPLRFTGKFLDIVDRSIRLTAEQAFKKTTGKVKGLDSSEGAMRDFINQLGNYNKRTQNQAIAYARQLGVGPFATAGSTFYINGLKSLWGGHGYRTNNAKADLKLRAAMMGRLVAVLAAVPVINYLQTGRVDGDDNTPLGAIYLGKEEETDERGKKRTKTKYFDLAALTGFTRGAREVGLQAAAESARPGARKAGATVGSAVDKGVDDAVKAIIHPFTGPLVGSAYTTMTGKDLIGRQLAAVPSTATTPEGKAKAKKMGKPAPGESQIKYNAIAAGIHANPVLAALIELGGFDPAHKKTTGWREFMKQLGRYGIKEAQSPRGAPHRKVEIPVKSK